MSRVKTLAQQLGQSLEYFVVHSPSIYLPDRLESHIKPTYSLFKLHEQANIEEPEDLCLFYMLLAAVSFAPQDPDGFWAYEDCNVGYNFWGQSLARQWDFIKDPHVLANLDSNFILAELFPSKVPVFMAKERAQLLREIGLFLNTHTDFTFEKLFLKHRRDVYLVSQVLSTYLPLWEDPFCVKGQLFALLVYHLLQEQWELGGIENLTAVPNILTFHALNDLGVVSLSSSIAQRAKIGLCVQKGSRFDLELRAACVLGSEGILEALRPYQEPPLDPAQLTGLLWDRLSGSCRFKHLTPAKGLGQFSITILAPY